MFSKKDSSGQTLWVGLSFLVLGLMLGLLITNGKSILGSASSSTGDDQSAEALIAQLDPDQLTQVDVSLDDDPMIGDPEAPITLVEFGDFQCPRCYEFHRDTFPQIKQDYIDKGIVKFVYRDFPLGGHPQADTAALAADCARGAYTEKTGYASADELYFKASDLIITHLMDWSGQDTADQILTQLVKDNLGVDIGTCMADESFKDEIEADYTAGRSYGVGGTPTFFINGRRLVGAWPFEAFQKIFEAQMKPE